MMTLLIVDDDKTYRQGMAIALRAMDRMILEARDYNEAIEVILTKKVDLICTDYNMPSGTGLDLIKFLGDKKLKIPVIVFSVEDEYEDNVTNAGAKYYFVKGHTPLQEIRDRVEQLLMLASK